MNDAAHNDLDIEVVDDTPVEDQKHRAAAPEHKAEADGSSEDELENYSEGVQKRIKKLKWEYHEERRAKEAAAREQAEAVSYARQVAEQNRILQEQISRGEAALIEQAKARVAAEIEKAKRSYREAYEAGDTDKVIEAQEAITRATMERTQFDNWKPRQVQAAPQAPVQAQPQRPVVDEKAKSWGDRNKWFGDNSDEDHVEMTATAYGIHERLVRAGVDPASDDYFEKIDAGMRKRYPEYFSPEEDKPSPQQAKPANVVAPAGRTIKQPRKVTLTATQVSLAKKLGLTPEQYAAQIVKEMGNE